MRMLIRLAAGILCVGMLVLVVSFDPAYPLTFSALWDPNPRDSMTETLTRSEYLKQLHEASYRRIDAKWQIAKEVIAGQQSLAEAIEQFRELDQQWPDLRSKTTKPELLWMSEDEWDGRAVLEQVRQVLTNRPEEAAAITDRLEKELQELLSDRKKCHSSPADPRPERRR